MGCETLKELYLKIYNETVSIYEEYQKKTLIIFALFKREKDRLGIQEEDYFYYFKDLSLSPLKYVVDPKYDAPWYFCRLGVLTNEGIIFVAEMKKRANKWRRLDKKR